MLTDAGTPYIYCVGGSAAVQTDMPRSRIPLQPCYRRNQPRLLLPGPVPWERFCPVVSQSSTTSSTSWADSTPSQRRASDQPDLGVYSHPAAWVQRAQSCLFRSGYIPTTTIGSLIYTGGGSDITAGALTDTTNSFVITRSEYHRHDCRHTASDRGNAEALNFNGNRCM